MTKQMMAIAPEARKIEARNGGSITKNMTTPATSATTLAIIATATHILRNCIDTLIANVRT